MESENQPLPLSSESSQNGTLAQNHQQPATSGFSSGLAFRTQLRTSRILTVQSGLMEDGRRFARASGATEAHEEELVIVREHADAVARDAAGPSYDPTKNAQDHAIETEYQKLLRDRNEEELGLKHAHVTLATRKDEAARAWGRVPPMPAEPSLWLKAATVVALAATIAPAAHDFLWIFENAELISWFLSILTGLVFGLLITLLILADQLDSERRTVMNWMGLGGGIGIGVALFLLRVKDAADSEQFYFGLATSILEIAIVIFLESLAISRRRALRQRQPLALIATEADGMVQAQDSEVTRRKATVTSINEQIGDHAKYLEARHQLATNMDEIRESARKAAEAGYLRGISENRGKVMGVTT